MARPAQEGSAETLQVGLFPFKQDCLQPVSLWPHVHTIVSREKVTDDRDAAAHPALLHAFLSHHFETKIALILAKPKPSLAARRQNPSLHRLDLHPLPELLDSNGKQEPYPLDEARGSTLQPGGQRERILLPGNSLQTEEGRGGLVAGSSTAAHAPACPSSSPRQDYICLPSSYRFKKKKQVTNILPESSDSSCHRPALCWRENTLHDLRSGATVKIIPLDVSH